MDQIGKGALQGDEAEFHRVVHHPQKLSFTRNKEKQRF